MIPPALVQARRDPRLRRFPRAIVVLQFCTEYLDSVDFRPLKIEVVAHECGCKFDSAVESLRLLRDAGYIARGDRPRGQPNQYRLLPAPLLPVVKRQAA